MPKHELPIIAVVENLENAGCYVEALNFPEILRFHFDEEKAVESLEANIRKIVEDSPLVAIHQRHPAGPATLDEVTIKLEPPRGQNLWRAPVTLRFSVVRWRHGDAAQLAYIPALCIVVVATKPATKEALDELIERHIHATLARRDSIGALAPLVWIQRGREIKLIHSEVEVFPLTPRQIASNAARKDAEKQSALAESGVDLTKEKLPIAYELDETVSRIAEILTGRAPSSVLLVGRSGVGKTAAVYELARRRQDFQLAHTPFWATNGARLIAGMSGFGQWQERCQRLWREAAQMRAIVYLGNLMELQEAGKSGRNDQGIADFLRPYIARGDVLSIAECAPEQLALIERSNPRMLDAFQQIKIEELSPEQSRGALLNVALAHGAGNGIELEAIERIDQLHRRYASYSAFPGRPLRFLKNLLQDRPEEKTLNAEEVTEAFSRETGLPRVLLDERERLELESVRAWFASRVIGQPDAVDLIVDMLAMVKAGLTRPRKPIASLLFIGPTGVGKTEMAKSLAEFLFQDRNRMSRFDMSEYASPIAVQRLIGGSFGQTVDGSAEGEGLLTAKARQQPFAVILLDEFEKAHPSFFDLLLQILGEGRLTDAMGRAADFSNSVVIMTSNLGAESFQRGLVGFKQAAGARQAASKHFTTAVREALRPELFNRIDRIVPFAPLDEASALRIVEREIERIGARDGIRPRNLTMHVGNDVASYLARRGYSARYGARPLKRVIERELLVPLSEQLNQRKDDDPAQIHLWLETDKLKIEMRQGSSAKSEQRSTPPTSLAALARQCSTLRRESQALRRGGAVNSLQTEIHTLRRIERQLNRGKWKNPDEAARVAELPKLERVEQAIRDFGARVAQLEREITLAYYEKSVEVPTGIRLRYTDALADWKALLLRLYTLRIKQPDQITLAVFSDDHELLFELARVYYLLAVKQIGSGGNDRKVEVQQFFAKSAPQTKKKKASSAGGSSAQKTKVDAPDLYFAAPRENVLCIALGIRFPLAFPKLESERGLHTFTRNRKSSRCLVEISEAAIDEYDPPATATRHDAIGHQEKRRNYNADQALIDDLLLNRREQWSGQLTVDFLGWLIEESLMAKVNQLIEIPYGSA
jgi:ATP-dependent Clp protease ATP-binding subunit ClpA